MSRFWMPVLKVSMVWIGLLGTVGWMSPKQVAQTFLAESWPLAFSACSSSKWRRIRVVTKGPVPETAFALPSFEVKIGMSMSVQR